MYYDFEKNRINFFHVYRGLLKFYYLLIVLFYNYNVLFYNYNFLKDYIIRIALLINYIYTFKLTSLEDRF